MQVEKMMHDTDGFVDTLATIACFFVWLRCANPPTRFGVHSLLFLCSIQNFVTRCPSKIPSPKSKIQDPQNPKSKIQNPQNPKSKIPKFQNPNFAHKDLLHNVPKIQNPKSPKSRKSKIQNPQNPKSKIPKIQNPKSPKSKIQNPKSPQSKIQNPQNPKNPKSKIPKIQNPKSKIPKIQNPSFFGRILGILGILDFGFWGFWILDFGILGRSRGCTTRQFGDGAWRSEARIPPGLPLGATSKPTVSNRVGARKQIDHFFRGQNPTKSQKNPDFQPRGQNFTKSQKNLDFQPTSKQI